MGYQTRISLAPASTFEGDYILALGLGIDNIVQVNLARGR